MTLSSAFLRTTALCGSALAVALGSPAIAQEISTENAYSLDPILVRERDDKGEAADRASSVYVSDSETERAALGTAKDLFQGIANVSVGGAVPIAQKVYVNGIDLTNLTTQIDGSLQNNKVFHHTGTNIFDPGMLKFVRVDPGIAAADTGPNATAGAVVMETVDAADVLLPGKSFGGNVRLGYGDNGDTFSRSATLAGISDNGLEFLAYGRASTGNDFEDGDGNKVAGTAADLQTALLKLAYESEGGHRVEFSGQNVQDSGLRNEKPNFGGWVPPYEMAQYFYETERKNYSLRYSMADGSGPIDPEAVIGYSESRVSNLDLGYDGVSSTLSAKLQNTFYFADGSQEGGTVVAGIDYYDKDSNFMPGDMTEDSQNIGLFVQARFNPLEQLRLSAGARYDTQDFQGVDGTKLSADGFSGNLSATYFVNDAFSLRAGYSNVFGGYTLEDNYKFWDTDYSGLESSRGQNLTLGADYTSGAWHLGGELFATRIDDARMMYWDRPSASYVNEAAKVEAQGVNLNATYGWDEGFMRLTYTYSDLQVNGEDPGTYDSQSFGFGTPIGQRLALQVEQNVPQWNMLFGASLDWVADNDATANCATCNSLDGYTVVGVFADYTPPAYENLVLRARIDNLFDEDYSDRATYGADYPEDLTPLKEPGRTFTLEAVARF